MASPRPEWEPYKPRGSGARKSVPLDPGSAQAKRSVPTRPKSTADRVDTALRNLDIDRTTGKSPTVRRSNGKSPNTARLKGLPSGARTGGRAGSGSADASLMSSMMARLSRAEGALRVATDEIAQQDAVIRTLRQKVKHFESVGDPKAEVDSARRCRRLERTVHQMEIFLADYGMIWVGEDDEEDESPAVAVAAAADGGGGGAGSGTPAAARAPRGTGPVTPSDYDKILSNIAELNALAGEGVGTVAKRADGSAKIAMPNPVTLRLYANGMMLFDGPFRQLDESIAQSFLHDVLDGYFPTELQERFPDGIPFRAYDLRGEAYNTATGKIFPGVGHQVGGVAMSPQPKRASNVHSMGDLNSGAAPHPQSAASLLNKLPPTVIRKGKIIDIRGDIEGQLAAGGGGGGKVSVIDTEVVQGLKQNAAAIGDGALAHRPVTPADIATLQVKSIDGKETLVLKLRFSDTIGTARRYIDAQKPSLVPYKLVSAYPRKELADDAVLIDAGLTPRATVRMMPVRSA